MWRTLLKTATVGEIRTLLSPKFFRVFPASKITRAVRELLANYRDDDGFEAAVSHRGKTLEKADLAIRLDTNGESTASVDHGHGADVLELYFHQLFEEGPTLLDLRGEQFRAADDGLVWSPAALYVDWDEDFIGGVRGMYRGFYCDDDAQFEAGLEQLNLQQIGGILLEHFGGDEQRATEFEMARFHETFHEVLRECHERGRSLHHQFAALGIYLATLYDHLGTLRGGYDARGAFERAVDP